MALKHTWTQQIKNDAGAAVASDNPLVILGEAEENFYAEVGPTDTVEIDLVVDVSEIRSGFLFSSLPVTISTNAQVAASSTIPRPSVPMVSER